MRRSAILSVLPIVTLLLVGCESHTDYVIRGTLYTDSTKTAAIAGDTLYFHETEYLNPTYKVYLGHAVTNIRGQWGFQYIHGLDNPYMTSANAKMTKPENHLLITHGGDTLYWDDIYRKDMIEVWPGCWQPLWRHHYPDTTSTDSTKWEGVLR